MAKPQLSPLANQLEELRLLTLYCGDQAKQAIDRDSKARWEARTRAANNAWSLQNSIIQHQEALAR